MGIESCCWLSTRKSMWIHWQAGRQVISDTGRRQAGTETSTQKNKQLQTNSSEQGDGMQTDWRTVKKQIDRRNANKRFKGLFCWSDSFILLALRGRRKRRHVRERNPSLTSQCTSNDTQAKKERPLLSQADMQLNAASILFQVLFLQPCRLKRYLLTKDVLMKSTCSYSVVTN